MPIVPLHGHAALRRRLLDAAARDALPASLLLQGPRGVGKQRLALWLGQALLCEGAMDDRADGEPCARCRHCRYAVELTHPDLHWYFPRPRPKDADQTPAEVQADYAVARAERVERHGLYGPASGMEALFVATVRSLVSTAAVSPALARRKVFVVGDAERLVAQEGADAAANAFLKLLEEPPADTVLILTSSEPGALLPTIRSRVVTLRVPPLGTHEVEALLADPQVRAVLESDGVRDTPAALASAIGGAPGALFGGAASSAAAGEAQRLLASVLQGGRPERLRAAFMQGASKARGAFSDVLDALTVALRDVARDASAPRSAADSTPRDERRALAASRGVDAVERAKLRAAGNVSPQLLTAELLRELAAEFG
ncbi:MAG: DNA polymerase III subunit [Gemmatirosa sp.]